MNDSALLILLSVFIWTNVHSNIYIRKAKTLFFCMDQDTFEQITIAGDFVGDAAAFLQDSMIVNISMYEGRPIVALSCPIRLF